MALSTYLQFDYDNKIKYTFMLSTPLSEEKSASWKCEVILRHCLKCLSFYISTEYKYIIIESAMIIDITDLQGKTWH